MIKKLISVLMVLVLLCLSLAGCGCDANNSSTGNNGINSNNINNGGNNNNTPASVDSDSVAEEKIDELMNNFKDALNNQDRDAYNKLTTDRMRASDNDINTHFDQILEFILKTIAFDGKKQEGTTYEILVHYYVTFSRDYTGTQYQVGISNMSNTFVFVKEGDDYKIDSINNFD